MSPSEGGSQTLCRTGFAFTATSYKPKTSKSPYKEFKMETTRSIRKALSPGDWVTSINLKDAYFHVPVHPDFRKYLRVAVGGKVYQFRALPFGLSPAPREFCRVTGVLGTLVHKLTIYLHLYLDDWLLRATSRAIFLAHTQIALEKVQNLAFLVNWAKSEIVPTQRFVLGEAYDLVAGLVRPSEEAVAKVLTLCRVLRRQPLQTAHSLFQLLGVLNSVADIIPYGWLHMRPLQLFLIAQWSMASQPLCFLVRFNEVFFRHLEWWENEHNLTCGGARNRLVPHQAQQAAARLRQPLSGPSGVRL